MSRIGGIRIEQTQPSPLALAAGWGDKKALRALIRKTVALHDSCPSRAAAVRNLRHVIAFTAQGLAKLEAVARDYDPIP